MTVRAFKTAVFITLLGLPSLSLGSPVCLELLKPQRLNFFQGPTRSETEEQQRRLELIQDEEARLIEADEFAGILEATNRVLDIAAQGSRSVFIGIGRSPTPITAMLKAMGVEDVYNVPLSAFRARSHLGRVEAIFKEIFLGSSYSSRLTEEKEQMLFDHFKNYLPFDSEGLNERSVYLIDLAVTGTGLVAATDYIKRFYESEGIEVDVKPIVLRSEDIRQTSLVDELLFADTLTFDSNDSPFGYRLQRQGYDILSPYGQFNTGVTRWRPIENPLYERLINELIAYLEN